MPRQTNDRSRIGGATIAPDGLVAILKRNRWAIVTDATFALLLVAVAFGPTSYGNFLGNSLQTLLIQLRWLWLLAYVVFAELRLWPTGGVQPWEYSSFFGHKYFGRDKWFQRWALGRNNALFGTKFTILLVVSAFIATIID